MERHRRLAIGSCAAVFLSACLPALGEPPAAADQGLYERIVEAYMAGNWKQLDKELAAPAKDLAALSAARRADVAYVRAAKAECYPPWWQQVKADTASTFRPTLWGRTIPMTYEPGNLGLRFEILNNQMGMTVSWPPAELDDTSAAGEPLGRHGFTKADLANLGVWSTLGNAAALSAISPKALAAMTEDNNTRLQQYLEFCSCLTALYYTPPPARRAGLAAYLSSFLPKYGSGSAGGSRRAVGSLFLAAVLADPARFPSLPLPANLPAEKPEEQLAVHYKFKIGPAWTIAEDKLLREAMAKFLKANDASARDKGVVALPNGLMSAFDAAEDEPLRAKRDKWVQERFDKARPPAPAPVAKDQAD